MSDERLAELERRMEGMERSRKRYRLVVLALVGVALVGAIWDNDAEFDTVTARKVFIENKAGVQVVALTSWETTGLDAGGALHIYDSAGKLMAGLWSNSFGGKGGMLDISNVVQARVDEHGNGFVSVYDSRGTSRTLKVGP